MSCTDYDGEFRIPIAYSELEIIFLPILYNIVSVPKKYGYVFGTSFSIAARSRLKQSM